MSCENLPPAVCPNVWRFDLNGSLGAALQLQICVKQSYCPTDFLSLSCSLANLMAPVSCAYMILPSSTGAVVCCDPYALGRKGFRIRYPKPFASVRSSWQVELHYKKEVELCGHLFSFTASPSLSVAAAGLCLLCPVRKVSVALSIFAPSSNCSFLMRSFF
jgi:hypothetical protein